MQLLRERLGYICIAVMLTAWLSACESATGPTPALPDLAGSYALTEMDGQPLPVQYYYSAHYDTRSDYVGGTLVLSEDSTFAVSYTIRYTRGTLGGRLEPGSEWSYELSGTYSVRPDTLIYRFSVAAFPELVARLVIPDATTVHAPTSGAPVARFQHQQP